MSKKKKPAIKTTTNAQQSTIKRKDGYAAKIAPKSISIARQDIATRQAALRQAGSADNPKRVKLQYLYNDIIQDALLTSQIENRKLITQSAPFVLKTDSGEIDQASTDILKSASFFNELRGHMIDSKFYGPTVVELITDDSGIKVILIPRTNIIPEKGILLYDETSDKGDDYRNTKEYGTWLLEFGNIKDYGLLNKAIPHVLFKRFAQSCWSELCEIYGIPPRVLKTNTQDAAMLTRAESMMRDMGAAAWFVIDETEEFDFAKGADTNGDVYNNLIRLCNNEMSLLFSGAVIGQDTKNGNESKEKVSVSMLTAIAEADKRTEATYMNERVLPALFRIGLIPDGLHYEHEPQEDTGELYTRTIGFLPYMDVDPEWIKQKFGIEVTGLKQKTTNPNFQ